MVRCLIKFLKRSNTKNTKKSKNEAIKTQDGSGRSHICQRQGGQGAKEGGQGADRGPGPHTYGHRGTACALTLQSAP